MWDIRLVSFFDRSSKINQKSRYLEDILKDAQALSIFGHIYPTNSMLGELN